MFLCVEFLNFGQKIVSGFDSMPCNVFLLNHCLRICPIICLLLCTSLQVRDSGGGASDARGVVLHEGTLRSQRCDEDVIVIMDGDTKKRITIHGDLQVCLID